jgi:endonuclease/exonuclease/phosphatase (EEP) superfamily protein YafD
MRRINGLIVALCVAYAIAVVVWQGLRLIAGDRWWWLASANVFSPYLFLPLLVLLPLAFLSRRRAAIVATVVPSVVFVLLYGRFFLPRLLLARASEGMPLRVMTLNVLYLNDDGAALERLAADESPDLICLQELTPRLAADLENRLGHEYPYRIVRPEEGTIGLGVYSRYPLVDNGEISGPGEELGWWAQSAQAIIVEFEEQRFLLLNVHALPPEWPSLSGRWPRLFEAGFRLREQEIQIWLDRVEQYEGPAIIAGDFNMADQSRAYRLLAAQLQDAHGQAGWGLGHTAPASGQGLDGVPLPGRLARIDYVWSSDHWDVLDAHVGRWDGQSDHLPVLAQLRLQTE